MSNVLDRVDAYVAEHHHSNRSFVKEVLAGRSTPHGLRRWATQKYHQTYEQNRTFSAIHSNSPWEAVRQFMVEQLIAEETGLDAGSAAHYELMRRFAIAMGATAEEIRTSTACPQVSRFVDFLMRSCRKPSFLDGMLPIYINESQAHDSASKLYTYLKSNYKLSEHDLEWFWVHGEVDKEHSGRGRALIAKYAPLDPDFERRALEIAEQACNEWLLLHDFYASLLENREDRSTECAATH